MASKVEIVQGKAFKLEPGKKYLLVFDNRTISKDDVEYLGEAIKKEYGADCPLSVVLNGDTDSMKVVEES